MLRDFLKSLLSSFWIASCSIILLTTVLSGTVFSGTWRVIPIRLDFDQQTRSGIVTITNDSDENIAFSIVAREWTQDGEGKDIYSETSDILFFPKSLTIPPNGERIIRAGIKVPALGKEKTYRLFIKQEVAPQDVPGTAVAIAIRFGVPIFAKPLTEDLRGEITQATIKDGSLTIAVNNNGNTHFRFKTLQISAKDSEGTPIFAEELTGGYFLAGTERKFSLAIPESVCRQISQMDIEVDADPLHLNREINVDNTMCLTP